MGGLHLPPGWFASSAWVVRIFRFKWFASSVWGIPTTPHHTNKKHMCCLIQKTRISQHNHLTRNINIRMVLRINERLARFTGNKFKHPYRKPILQQAPNKNVR